MSATQRRNNPIFCCAENSGYSLLEVLIALFILAFGLLSLASASSAALRRTHDSFLSDLAIIWATNFQEAAEVGDEGTHYGKEWHKKIEKSLPDGVGKLSKSKTGYKDSVCFSQHFQQAGGGKSGTRCVELEGGD